MTLCMRETEPVKRRKIIFEKAFSQGTQEKASQKRNTMIVRGRALTMTAKIMTKNLKKMKKMMIVRRHLCLSEYLPG